MESNRLTVGRVCPALPVQIPAPGSLKDDASVRGGYGQSGDKFWDRHAQEMRKARLLQAATLLYNQSPVSIAEAVKTAIEIETEIGRQTGLTE